MNSLPPSSSVAERLRHFAISRFGRLSAFGAAVGLSPSQVTLYTSGHPKPGFDLLFRLQSVGCSIDWLLSGEGPMLLAEVKEYHPLFLRPHLEPVRSWLRVQMDAQPREYDYLTGGEKRAVVESDAKAAAARLHLMVDHLGLSEVAELLKVLSEKVASLADDTQSQDTEAQSSKSVERKKRRQ